MTIFATDLAMDPVELAREAEARGFHSLYVPEHTHIPTSPAHAAADGRRGAGRGVQAHARSRTSRWPRRRRARARIRLGTGIALPAQHDPIALAKQVATLDRLSPRSARARRRLRLEPGGDGEPRHRHHAAARARARGDARDAGALGARRWPSSAASSCASSRAGSGRSRCSSRGRPCCSAARRARPCSPTSPSTPTAGSRSAAPALREALPELRRAMEARGRDFDALRIVPMGVLPSREKLDLLPRARRPRGGAARALGAARHA